MTNTIFLSAGHSTIKGRDRGASSGSYVEGELAAQLRGKLATKLRSMGLRVFVDPDQYVTKETVAFWKTKIPADAIALDIHFNAAGNPLVWGTEVLIPANPTPAEVRLADLISDTTSRVLGNPERGTFNGADGVKTERDSHHKKLAWMTLGGVNVLWEVEFITNPEAMKIYIAKLDELVEEIALTIKTFCDEA